MDAASGGNWPSKPDIQLLSTDSLGPMSAKGQASGSSIGNKTDEVTDIPEMVLAWDFAPTEARTASVPDTSGKSSEQLEEQLNALKFTVNLTCEHALASVHDLEKENESLRKDNITLRDNKGSSEALLGEIMEAALPEESTPVHPLRTVARNTARPLTMRPMAPLDRPTTPLEECPTLTVPGQQGGKGGSVRLTKSRTYDPLNSGQVKVQKFRAEDQDQLVFGGFGPSRSSKADDLQKFLAETKKTDVLLGSGISSRLASQDRVQDMKQKFTVPGSVPQSTVKFDDKPSYVSEGTSKPRSDQSDGSSSPRANGEEADVGHQAKFVLLQMWLPVDEFETRGSLKAALQNARSGRNASMGTMGTGFLDHYYLADKLEKEREDKSDKNAVHPQTMKRGIWDLISMALVIYDMVFIPLQFFDLPPNTLITCMAWTTRLFWTGDILASFVTGYVRSDGSYELCLQRIGKRYLMTWFAFDAIIVFADWMEIFWDVTGGAGYARMGKATRVLRIVRMVRLLRLVRMQMLIKLIIERINSERLSIIANILRLITAIGGLAHIMACIWYGISVNAGEEAWVVFYDLVNEKLPLKYTCALHWSFSQFAGGMDEFVPHNIDERVFAIVVFLLAFVLSGLFVSSLTSSMTQLAMVSNLSYQTQLLSTLRKYIQQNGISKRLAMRVQRNASYALHEQQRFLPEDQVVVMAIVSEPLRVEVHFEMYSRILSHHPFFKCYIEECPQVMRKVAHRSMTMVSVSPGDVIFSPGEIALQPRMFFICDGTLQYIAVSATVSIVEERAWISEAVIWTQWMHRGQLTAVKECRICALDATVFQHIVSSFEHPDFDPRHYAAAFVKDLNDHLVEAVDLPSPNFDYETALGSARFKKARRKKSTRLSVVKDAVRRQISK